MRLFHRIATSRPKSYVGFVVWGFVSAIAAELVWSYEVYRGLDRADAFIMYVVVTVTVTALVFRRLVTAAPPKQAFGFSLVALLLPFALVAVTAVLNVIEFKALEPPPLPMIQTPGLGYLATFVWGCLLGPFGVISTFVYWLVYARRRTLPLND